MVEDNRTWVHPNAIRRGEPGESGRYLHYFRHWHHFTLKMDDYRFTRWFASHNTHQRADDPDFDAAAKKLAEQGWEALNKDEQEVFEEHQMKEIGAEAQPDGISLEGWGRLEGGIGRETITAFAVNNDPAWRSRDFDENYEKTFKKVRIGILSASEEHPGAMSVWGESMRDIYPDDMADGEDVLYAQFYMLPEKLKMLAREVASQPVKPTLTLHAEGLIFRDEVDASLSELWHPCEYVIIYDHHHRVVLNSIRFDLQMGAVQAAQITGDDDDEVAAPVMDRPAAQPSSALIPDAVVKNLRGLKYAIWILAAAVVLAALIR